MARIKFHKREMTLELVHFFLFFQSLFQINHSLETVESHSQAFIQTDRNQLTYMVVGDVSGIPIEVKPGQVYTDFVGKDDKILVSSSIRFDPAMLDFQEQAVGMPRMEQVIVQNTDPKNNLHLLSISGSTAHFHCSFFQDKIVPPGGNTTFDVVFLARQEGNVENTLYIHTSQGSFKYQVFGVGVPNPYRLRPYLGARVPVNSSFSPLINMHNPHSSTLQVLEMFSSEGDLHLELPTGEKEAPRSLWEIPPYETRTVMKAIFIGRVENNHTAFIRIRTNQKKDKQLLVLPVEVEVTSSPGVYAAQELIHFGILRTLDEPKTIAINLINIGSKAVQITGVTLFPPNDAISVDFRPTKLQPDPSRQTTIAHITFRAAKAIHPKLWSGKIIVKSKNNQHRIIIPYQAVVLHGSLAYHLNMTYFFAHNEAVNYSRAMTFTNTFNFSVVIYNVTLSANGKDYFSILNFMKPVILQPQKTLTAFRLEYHPRAIMSHFRTKLVLHTNASDFEIPLIVFNGQFKFIPHRPEKFQSQLDFGTMGVKENRSMLFTLVNDNPVELFIHEFTTDMKGATLEVHGIEKGNGTTLSRVHNKTLLATTSFIIPPYHFAVVSLNLIAPEEEGSYQAEVIISSQFQESFIPVLVRTAEGSLNAIPDKIVFDKVYPGKIPYKVLQIHSTFEENMEVTRVAFQPPDSRFYYERPREEPIMLEPQNNNVIGKIFFNAKKECKEECYVGLPTYTPAGHQWLQGLSLDKEVADTDEYLFKYLRKKWKDLRAADKHIANVTIELDTSQVQGFLFSAQSQFYWPDVTRKCHWPLKFPLTQIGNISTADFMVENPGDTSVLVQILALPLYPNPQTIIDLFDVMDIKLPSHFSEYLETDDKDVFVLYNMDDQNAKPDSAINKFRNQVESFFGVKTHRDSVTFMLAPRNKIKITVGFRPKDDSLKTSFIIVRNNLTIIDVVALQGQGGRGEMKLNNRKPGASTLQFDITEKHLKNCDKRKHSKNMVPNFTVKRSFTLKNTGELPFYVHSYSINDLPCEGYGFRILDCEGFEMERNTSRKIDIAFTPDFTMSRIRRVLTVHTSLGSPFNYTLQATVPPHTLSKCAASLPRPNWEPVLYYSVVCVMGFFLFCILVASYFEADRIFVADILKRKVKTCSNGALPYRKEDVFDLKQIGASALGPVKHLTHSVVEKTAIQHHPRPILELTNNHVEHKTKEPFITTLICILKSFFIRKSHGRKKNHNNNIERQNSAEKDVKPPTANSSTGKRGTETEKPGQHNETIITEKSTVTQSKITGKKPPKAAKRAHSELQNSSDTHSNSGQSDRKQGNRTYTNTTAVEKKTAEQVSTKYNNTPKEKTNTTNMTTPDGVSGPDPVTYSDARLEDLGKQKGKKKPRKPECDTLLKDRILTTREGQDDKDETSSTTTESSAGDGDEKSSSARDSTPEPLPPAKPKKSKSKSRHLDLLIIPPVEDDLNNNDDFELTSKSRAHKKIKVSQKDIYGGNILRPSTYELPYSMSSKKPSKKTAMTNGTVKKSAPAEKPKTDGDMCVLPSAEHLLEAADKHDSENDSPPPQWDEPSPVSLSGDLSELSIQTDQFAQKQAKSLESGGQPGFSPDALTNSSRSSSYSSIVSSSSGEGANGKNKGPAATDSKRYPAGFTPFGDNSLAAITPKTPPIPSKGNTQASGKMRNAWGGGSSAPTTPEVSLGPLQTIQEASRTGTTVTDSLPDTFNQADFPFGTSTSTTSDASAYGFSGYDTNHSMTMMQRLQRDRRRRVREHQLRVMREDWPGFDLPATRSESLWDSEYNPLDAGNPWSVNSDSPPTTSSSGLWSTLTNSANSGWTSLMSNIWSGTATTTTTNPLASEASFTSADGAGTMVNTSVGQSGEALGTFNPFNSMADIWSPSASTADSTGGWNIPTSSSHPPGEKETK